MQSAELKEQQGAARVALSVAASLVVGVCEGPGTFAPPGALPDTYGSCRRYLRRPRNVCTIRSTAGRHGSYRRCMRRPRDVCTTRSTADRHGSCRRCMRRPWDVCTASSTASCHRSCRRCIRRPWDVCTLVALPVAAALTVGVHEGPGRLHHLIN